MTDPIIMVAGAVDKTVDKRSLPTSCAKCGTALVYDPMLVDHTRRLHPGRAFEFQCHACAAPFVAGMTDQELDHARAVAAAQPELAHRIDQVTNDQIRRFYGARTRQ
jgi:hypothetical protein